MRWTLQKHNWQIQALMLEELGKSQDKFKPVRQTFKRPRVAGASVQASSNVILSRQYSASLSWPPQPQPQPQTHPQPQPQQAIGAPRATGENASRLSVATSLEQHLPAPARAILRTDGVEGVAWHLAQLTMMKMSGENKKTQITNKSAMQSICWCMHAIAWPWVAFHHECRAAPVTNHSDTVGASRGGVLARTRVRVGVSLFLLEAVEAAAGSLATGGMPSLNDWAESNPVLGACATGSWGK